MSQYKLKQTEADFIIGVLHTYSIFVKRESRGSPNAAFSFASGNKVTIALGIIIVEVWNPDLQAYMRTDYRDPYKFFEDYQGDQDKFFEGLGKFFKKIIGK